MGILQSLDIEAFLHQSVGEWMSQQTSHQVAFRRYESGQSTLEIEWVRADAPEAIAACEQHGLNPAIALGGLSTTWRGRLGQETVERTERNLLILLPDRDNPRQGKLVYQLNGDRQSSVRGTYSLGSDEALTLITIDKETSLQERIWFASENLRLRSAVCKQQGGFSTASLNSDIRRLSRS
ncbi:phycobiliprotein lyase [Synechococcus sp. PCC 7336]|uniref:phycobiliprotein lyase n=1 Tax=Synechococcus sp. PCC 7336 TaxID=195250 RepID=UPI00034D6562|nr:phycobiliprotein lyase [Synechococcus sp. PCC 7336]